MFFITFLLIGHAKYGKKGGRETMITKKNVTDYDYAKIGERIKLIANENGYKRERMKELLEYSTVQQVSGIYSGKLKLPKKKIEKVAEHFNVRIEYLLGEDIFKTEYEILCYERMLDINAFKACKDYLNTLGYNIEPFLSLHIDIVSLYKHWDIISPYITPNSLANLFPITDKYIYYKCSDDYDTFETKYQGKFLVIELTEPIDSLDIPYSNTGKTNANIKRTYHINGEKSVVGEDYSYTVGYRVNQKGTNLGVYSVESMQKLFNLIDSYTKCTLENFINNEHKMHFIDTSSEPIHKPF